MRKEKKIICARSRYLRISPSKINVVLKKIRGKTYREAMLILRHMKQKAGAIIWQTLYSAVSNAANNYSYQKDKLFIALAFVNQGAILKRMQPRAKGRSFKIEKKLSHLEIGVTEKIEEVS